MNENAFGFQQQEQQYQRQPLSDITNTTAPAMNMQQPQWGQTPQFFKPANFAAVQGSNPTSVIPSFNPTGSTQLFVNQPSGTQATTKFFQFNNNLGNQDNQDENDDDDESYEEGASQDGADGDLDGDMQVV